MPYTLRCSFVGCMHACVLSHFGRVGLFAILLSSMPGSSVHVILQARMLKSVVMPSSRESSWPRYQTRISCVSCIGRQVHYPLSHVGNPLSSVAQSCPTLCSPMNCSTPGLPVHHQPLEFTQTHVHWVSDAIQPSHPLSSPYPPALNLSQYQGLFKWVSSSHQVAKVLEFQLKHQSFQWTPRTDLL